MGADTESNGHKIAKIYVKKPLDREDTNCHNDKGKCVYPVQVSALNNNGIIGSTKFNIEIEDQNDEQPVIKNAPGAVYSVNENQQDKVVFQLNVEDKDSNAAYGKQSIVYYPIKNLVQFNRDGTETIIDDIEASNFFTIDPSGAVRTGATAEIDAEQVLKYTMNIKVRDGGAG